jgi:hypothetical protein
LSDCVQFLITIYSGALINSQLLSIYHYRYYTVCLQFTIHTLSPLGLLSHTSPLIPASNGGHSPSWDPELSLRYSHSNSHCHLHLQLPPLVSCCSVWSSPNNCLTAAQSQSHVTTEGQSVSQYVLMSSLFWFSLPDICYCLTITVVSLWGALSEERSGLSIASQNLQF